MQHANVAELISAIKNIEKADLTHALMVTGKTFIPKADEPIHIEFYGGNGPTSAEVIQVNLHDAIGYRLPKIKIVVKDDDGATFTVTPEDCYPGSLSVITQAI